MDSLKLIPSVFFDGIARVVPGATAILAYVLLSGSTWTQILERTMGASFAGSDALLPATGLFFFAAYVVGQLVAPFAKLAQRIGEWQLLRPKPEADSKAYDFLRLHYKDAGAQCAKIRAEFTMYNGMAVVLLASSICYPLLTTQWRRSVLVTLVGAAIATAIRGRTTRDTFNETVTKFVKNTTFPHPPPPNQRLEPTG